MRLTLWRTAHLLQAVDDGDEEADVRHSFVVQVPNPLHQLWRRGHCRHIAGGVTLWNSFAFKRTRLIYFENRCMTKNMRKK